MFLMAGECGSCYPVDWAAECISVGRGGVNCKSYIGQMDKQSLPEFGPFANLAILGEC